MDNTKRKGAISVTITYICWGLLTVFWNLLAEVNSAYVLAQRVVWSMLFMLGYLAVTGRWGDIRQVFADKKTMICCMVSGVLVCVNWGVYIFAINSGHVLDASLGYFLEPIFVTAIGVFLFHEKMSRLEQMTALFSIIGVGYLMGVYRMVPVMAMVIGLSFAFYGAVKKSVHLDAGLSLFAETLFVTPIALLFCVYSEMNGHGSLGVLHGMQFLLFPMAGVITSVSFVFGGISVMTCYALQGFSRGIASLLISALRQVIILLPLASIMGKMMGINGIWWSFLISETVTVVFAIIYLGIAEKKELSFLASMPLEQSIAE